MKERPILFSGEMVRAILEGRKTQTRRVIKPSKSFRTQCETYELHPVGGWHGYDGKKGSVPAGFGDGFYCPYGQPGDRLWVRETIAIERVTLETIEDHGGNPVPTDRPFYHHLAYENNEYDEEYWLVPHYRATDPIPELIYEDEFGDSDGPTCKWTPSIYMPRWASRIVLEITKIKAEHLQDLDLTGLEKEGMSGELYQAFRKFQNLWDSINAKKDYSFQTNPWVWVIEFKVVKNVA